MNETTKKIINAFDTKGYTLDKTYKLEDDVTSVLALIDCDIDFLKVTKINKTTKIFELNRTQRTVYEFVKNDNFFRVQENVKTGYIMTKKTYKKINKTTFKVEYNGNKYSIKNFKAFLGII
tara:strand:+ start:96 stop:458 length:363 start_codon:yes stop_codon:yes gene_type:complete